MDLVVAPHRSVQTTRFDRFWEAYPKRIGKKAARLVWDRIAPDEALTVLICTAVDRAKASRRWREGFIVDPERYLKQERWTDDLDADRPTLSKQTAQNVGHKLGSFLEGFR